MKISNIILRDFTFECKIQLGRIDSINYKLCLLRSSAICGIYMMKRKYRIPCIRDRRMALMVTAITFRCLHINPGLAQGTNGTASMFHQQSAWGRYVGTGREAHDILEELLFLDTHACEHEISPEMRTRWGAMTTEKFVRTSIFMSSDTRQHTCNHAPLHMNMTLVTYGNLQEHGVWKFML